MKRKSAMIMAAALTAAALFSLEARAQDWGKIGGSVFGGLTQLAEASKEITPSEEHYIGRAVAALIFEKYPLYNNPAMNNYLNKVGLAVAFHSDRPVTYGGYRFAVLDSGEINAFACPGGMILVTKGLMELLQNEDELAGVLGHEIRHVADRDGIKAIQKSRWTKFAFYTAGEVGKHYTPSEVSQLVGEFQGVVSDVAKKVIEQGYSKKDEEEADAYGMRYAMNAGYNPAAMADFIRTEIARGIGGSNSGPFSSHPTPEQRLTRVEARLSSEGLSGTTEAVRTQRYRGATAALK
ncbi:MAG: M48 family metalloprotease [Proteobacteria bacterium]|nr:M48 family metalloprotease [Pseudomonadota bacterium]